MEGDRNNGIDANDMRPDSYLRAYSLKLSKYAISVITHEITKESIDIAEKKATILFDTFDNIN